MGRVHEESGEYMAYDDAENYLGWTGDDEEAKYMAERGYVSCIQESVWTQCDLDMLWEQFRDEEFMLVSDDPPAQVLRLVDSICIVRHEQGGIDLVTEDKLYDLFGDEKFAGVLRLRYLRMTTDRETSE
jgi:hypothetical protein